MGVFGSVFGTTEGGGTGATAAEIAEAVWEYATRTVDLTAAERQHVARVRHGGAAAVYYVAATGNDANDGLSPAAAKATPEAVAASGVGLLSAGDVLVLGPGLYALTEPLVIPAGVTVQGAGRKATRLRLDVSAVTDATWAVQVVGNGATLRDLAIEAVGTVPPDTDGTAVHLEDEALTGTPIDRVLVERCDLTGEADVLRGHFTDLRLRDCLLRGRWDGIVFDSADTSATLDRCELVMADALASGTAITADTGGHRLDLIHTVVRGEGAGVTLGGAGSVARLHGCVVDTVGTALTTGGRTVVVSNTAYDPAKVSGTLTELLHAVSEVTGDVGGLATTAQTDVQAVLTAQGLTSARAAKLDNLDAAVSSVSGGGGGTVNRRIEITERTLDIAD